MSIYSLRTEVSFTLSSDPCQFEIRLYELRYQSPFYPRGSLQVAVSDRVYPGTKLPHFIKHKFAAARRG